MEKRLCLDHKSISTNSPAQIAKFVHELTLRGYEPLELQCVMNFGLMTVCMGLFKKPEDQEELNSEVNKTVTGDSSSPSEGKVEESVKGEETKGNEGQVGGSGDEQKSKPKPRTKTKPKTGAVE